MKIAIVNDSTTAMASLMRVIQDAEGMELAWTATDGREAVGKCQEDAPDVLLMDMIMPRLNGVDATREIMAICPCPILIVTGSVNQNVSEVFEAMGAGAIDVALTPGQGANSAEEARNLIQKINVVASLSRARRAELGQGGKPKPPESNSESASCVVIGSSAGGPAALVEIFADLPIDLEAAVIVIQHVDERFAGELVSWLASRSSLPVLMAEEGQKPSIGQILVSNGGKHLVFGEDHRLQYRTRPKLAYQPSVDIFFDSAVLYGPRSLLGVVLTGMGRDGAAGLKKIRDAGHCTIAQDEESSAIYGMPRAAAQMGGAAEILPLKEISSRIIAWSKNYKTM